MAPRRKSRSHRRRSRSRRTWTVYGAAIGAIFAGAALVIGLFHSRMAPPAREVAEPVAALSIAFNGPLGVRFAGELVAEEAGFFRRAHVQPDLRFGGSSDETIAAVVDGRATVGVADPITFLKARAKGLPIVAFAADYVENATVFYAMEKSGIRAPEDFVDKRVGRLAGSHSALFYDAMLNMRGISRGNIRETGDRVDVAGLLAGAIDVIPGRIGAEGFALRTSGAPFVTLRLFDFGIHVPDLVYFTGERTLRDRPSVLVRLVEAVVAGWSRTYVDPAAAARLVAAKAGNQISAEQAAFELSVQRDFVITVGRRVMEYDAQQWKQLVQLLVNARQLDEYFDLARAVNYDVLKDAYRRPISFGADPGAEPAPILGR